MEIILPKTDKDWEEVVFRVASCKPMKPFDTISLRFIQEVSNTIINNAKSKSIQNLELRYLAHWLSEAHLQELYKRYESRRQNRIWLPRGVVLHFPPANVDTLFIYSWFLSLLVGNINMIRLSRRRNQQVDLLLDALSSILEQEHFKPIKDRTLLVTYGHEKAFTKELSKFCHVRVIWGGDETVRQIRAIPLPPRATELVFADRFSMAAFRADAILHASDEEINELCHGFYFDTFFFSQRACSSPKLVFWIGEAENIQKAKNRFWLALADFVKRENINWEDGIGIARMTLGYWYAAEGIADKISTSRVDFPYRVHVQNFGNGFREMHYGGGVFLETERSNLMDIIELIACKDQTLAVYGFSMKELEELAWQLGGYGIDRIVPIGQALPFQTVWDGYDLFTYLTREVTVES